MAAPIKPASEKPAISVSIRLSQEDYDRLKAEQKQVALLAGFEPSLNVLITRLVTEALDLREQQRSK